MRHIDEIQIAGTAILLCGAMFAVSAVAPTGNTVSKAVTNFTEAPETAAEAQACLLYTSTDLNQFSGCKRLIHRGCVLRSKTTLSKLKDWIHGHCKTF